MRSGSESKTHTVFPACLWLAGPYLLYHYVTIPVNYSTLSFCPPMLGPPCRHTREMYCEIY